MSAIYASRIQTPDGTILQSFHRHDYKTYIDANQEIYMIDGGTDYFRSFVNQEPAKNISVYTDDPHELKRTIPVWGTYGKNGDEPYRVISVAEMTDQHMTALLDLGYVKPEICACILEEIEYRKSELFAAIQNSTEFTIENAYKAFVGEKHVQSTNL